MHSEHLQRLVHKGLNLQQLQPKQLVPKPDPGTTYLKKVSNRLSLFSILEIRSSQSWGNSDFMPYFACNNACKSTLVTMQQKNYMYMS